MITFNQISREGLDAPSPFFTLTLAFHTPRYLFAENYLLKAHNGNISEYSAYSDRDPAF
jgi:hypothetical protein